MEGPIGSPGMLIDTFTERADPRSRWFNISVICLAMSGVFYLLTQTRADPDLWGHVKFGQDLWHTGKIIQSDPYSYLTGDQLWINHEWLAEVIFSLAFGQAGPAGLVALKATVSLLIAALIFRHLCRQGLTPLRAGILLVALISLLIRGLITVRPQLFTLLFFSLILLLVHHLEHGHRRWLWGTPPLFALWTNLHGGVLAGLGILLLWCFSYLALVLWRTRRPALLISPSYVAIPLAVMGSVLAMVLNPYGVQLPEFLLRTATIPRPDISEWQPIVIRSTYGAIYLGILAVAVTGLFHSRRERRPTLVLLFICISLLPLTAVRHTDLFALAVAVLAGEHIGDAWDRVSLGWRSNRSAARANRHRPWLTGFSLVGAIVLVGIALPHFGCIRLFPIYPARAIALLKQSGVSGNLAVYFGWGEYAIWHLGPRIKVSVDGRRETVYHDEIRRQNQDFRLGKGEWDALLRKHETHLVLVSKKFPVFNLMQLKPDWLLVYEDPMSGLFVKHGSTLVGKIQETDPPALPYDGAGLCFP